MPASVETERRHWIVDVSYAEVVAYILWLVAEFAVALAGSLALVHHALSLPAHETFSASWSAHFGLVWGGMLLALAVLAGVLVFRRTVHWGVLLTWPWLVGPAVAAGFFFSEPSHGTARLCGMDDGDPCDFAWGFGAAVVAIGAAIVLGISFIAMASLKRLVLRRRGEPTR